jgi:hypothetical protein
MAGNKLNQARVADLHMTMAGYVERGDIPGIVTLIGRGDEVHVDAIGVKAVDGKEPMRRARSSESCRSRSPSLRPRS